MLSKLVYSSVANYYSKITGDSENAKRSRKIAFGIKAGKSVPIDSVPVRIREFIEKGYFAGVFGPDVLLIPTPGHAPLRTADTLQATSKLCSALVNAGLGQATENILKRSKAVQSSKTLNRGERVSVQAHFDSFEVTDTLLFQPSRIVLVDDIVSRGRTLIAGASRIQDQFPNLEIQAFAVFRTVGFGEIGEILAPFTGEISFDGDDANRQD